MAEKMQITNRYDDIISLPHHQSKTRPHMPLIDRAAQFSPFAALTGYDDAVKETARQTDRKAELSEEMQACLQEKLQILKARLRTNPEAVLTYFEADEKKAGGTYRSPEDRRIQTRDRAAGRGTRAGKRCSGDRKTKRDPAGRFMRDRDFVSGYCA